MSLFVFFLSNKAHFLVYLFVCYVYRVYSVRFTFVFSSEPAQLLQLLGVDHEAVWYGMVWYGMVWYGMVTIATIIIIVIIIVIICLLTRGRAVAGRPGHAAYHDQRIGLDNTSFIMIATVIILCVVT